MSEIVALTLVIWAIATIVTCVVISRIGEDK